MTVGVKCWHGHEHSMNLLQNLKVKNWGFVSISIANVQSERALDKW